MTMPRGLQQVFDRVAYHLLTQGEKAMIGEGYSRYRVKKHGKCLKCSIGCLFPDSLYDPIIEGKAADEVMTVGLPVSDHLKNLDVPSYFLVGMQIIHDKYRPRRWPNELKKFAESYGLKYRGYGKGNTNEGCRHELA